MITRNFNCNLISFSKILLLTLLIASLSKVTCNSSHMSTMVLYFYFSLIYILRFASLKWLSRKNKIGEACFSKHGFLSSQKPGLTNLVTTCAACTVFIGWEIIGPLECDLDLEGLLPTRLLSYHPAIPCGFKCRGKWT